MQPDHVDVLIVGAGLSGIGAAVHLQDELPGQELRDPRGARRDRRAPGTSSATRASARTPTCTRSATRSSRGRSAKAIADGPSILELRAARRRASTASTGTSASATASCAPSGRRDDARWTVAVERTDTGETVEHDLRLPLRLHAATTATTRATRPTSRAPSASAARSSTRSTGPRTSTTPASASSSSAAARPPSRSSRRWPSTPRT